MQLKDERLLNIILGLSNSKLQRATSTTAPLDLYSRATSSEGLLCIRKYWDAHCSTFSRVSTVALLDRGRCPRGLAPELFLQLLSRLTDLQDWQIWSLWTTLDIGSCGFVGCMEFSLLVVLLCAGAAQKQLQAVHAYASSICRTFTGQHVGGSWAGLCQCCQLMGLPTHALCKELGRVMHKNRSSSSSSSSSEADLCCIHSNSKLNSCSTNTCCKHHRVKPTNSCETGPTATNQALNVPGTGCCCSKPAQCSDKGEDGLARDLWACPARAHRQHEALLQKHKASAAQHCCSVTTSLHYIHAPMKAQDVELVLYHVAKLHNQQQQQPFTISESSISQKRCSGCVIC